MRRLKNIELWASLALIALVIFLLFRTYKEGFQTTLPTGSQTVTDFVIFADMNTIVEKLPFLHTNFTNVDKIDMTGLSTPLTSFPETVAKTSFMNLNSLIPSDNVQSLYRFKLKAAIVGPIDKAAVDALDAASQSMFGAPGKIAFRTSGGALYPSIALPAAPAGGSGGSPAPAPAAPAPSNVLTLTKQTSLGQSNWSLLAVSADGSKMFSINESGDLFKSINGGISFTKLSSIEQKRFTGLVCSNDGMKLAVCAITGISISSTAEYIYTSTDGGASWTQQTRAGLRNWYGLASSADGMKLAAIAIDSIYISTDGGVTWTQRAIKTSGFWGDKICMSNDGMKIFVGARSGSIHISTDGGIAWIEKGTPSGYSGLAISGDGLRIAYTAANEYITTSTDGGATWTQQTSAGQKYWRGLACSSDGMKLFAIVSDGFIYTSIDGGNTWKEQTSAGSQMWWNIKCSSDGSKVISYTALRVREGPPTPDDGYIFTGTFA